MSEGKIEGRFFALELTLAVLLGGIAKERGPKFIDKMHAVLTERVRTSAETVAAKHAELSAAEQMLFVESACDALDSLMSTAKVI